MRRISVVLLLPLVLGFATSVGAVTGRGESANQYVLAAGKALGSARSLRISGSIRESSGSEVVNLVIYSDNDLNGSLTIAGHLVDMTRIGETDYYRAPPAFWESAGKLPATLAKSLAPDWISLPNSSSDGMGTSFDFAGLVSSFESDPGLTLVGHQKVDGHTAVGVKTKNGDVLWVAASGKPYPISDVRPGTGTGSGTLTFSGWNAFKLPTAPKKSYALSSFH